MNKQLVNISQAAEALSVSRDSVRRLIERGQLKSVRILRRVMIPVTEVERLCRADSSAPGGQRQ